jgi:hypothetical protein
MLLIANFVVATGTGTGLAKPVAPGIAPAARPVPRAKWIDALISRAATDGTRHGVFHIRHELTTRSTSFHVLASGVVLTMANRCTPRSPEPGSITRTGRYPASSWLSSVDLELGDLPSSVQESLPLGKRNDLQRARTRPDQMCGTFVRCEDSTCLLRRRPPTAALSTLWGDAQFDRSLFAIFARQG